jgi:hypothetical protein
LWRTLRRRIRKTAGRRTTFLERRERWEPRRLVAEWFAGGGRGGCRLQHTTRGRVKPRAAQWVPRWAALPGRRAGGASGGTRASSGGFALPLLYAERARHWPGGMMGGPVPRAAVRASQPACQPRGWGAGGRWGPGAA